MLHPEEAWPRRWGERRWLVAGLAVAMLLVLGAVAAGIVLATSGGDRGPSPARATPAPAVLAPEAFDAKAAGLAVRLRWTAPADGAAIEHYEIYRNGRLLVTLSEIGTTYIDDGVRPGNEYTYEIAARGRVGGKEMVSDRISTVVKTPIPPLSNARLAGDFSVEVKTLSQSGYSTYDDPTYGWQFKPKCRRGTCDVKWSDLHEKGVHAVLQKHGASYAGSYSGFFFALCGDTRTTSSVTIELKVDKAKAIAGEWQATRLVGTLDQSESAQLGCVSSQSRQVFTAKLVR